MATGADFVRLMQAQTAQRERNRIQLPTVAEFMAVNQQMRSIREQNRVNDQRELRKQIYGQNLGPDGSYNWDGVSRGLGVAGDHEGAFDAFKQGQEAEKMLREGQDRRDREDLANADAAQRLWAGANPDNYSDTLRQIREYDPELAAKLDPTYSEDGIRRGNDFIDTGRAYLIAKGKQWSEQPYSTQQGKRKTFLGRLSFAGNQQDWNDAIRWATNNGVPFHEIEEYYDMDVSSDEALAQAHQQVRQDYQVAEGKLFAEVAGLTVNQMKNVYSDATVQKTNEFMATNGKMPPIDLIRSWEAESGTAMGDMDPEDIAKQIEVLRKRSEDPDVMDNPLELADVQAWMSDLMASYASSTEGDAPTTARDELEATRAAEAAAGARQAEGLEGEPLIPEAVSGFGRDWAATGSADRLGERFPAMRNMDPLASDAIYGQQTPGFASDPEGLPPPEPIPQTLERSPTIVPGLETEDIGVPRPPGPQAIGFPTEGVIQGPTIRELDRMPQGWAPAPAEPVAEGSLIFDTDEDWQDALATSQSDLREILLSTGLPEATRDIILEAARERISFEELQTRLDEAVGPEAAEVPDEVRATLEGKGPGVHQINGPDGYEMWRVGNDESITRVN